MTKIVKIKPDFEDERGRIIRPLSDILKHKISSVSLIVSKAGAIRGNHYHDKEAHYTYLVNGEAEHFERPANKPHLKLKKITLKEGDMIFNGHMKTHALKFKKDTTLLYLSTVHRTKKGDIGDTFKEKII